MDTARRRPAYEIISDVIDCIRWSTLGSTHLFDRLMVARSHIKAQLQVRTLLTNNQITISK